jgi:succinylglutamate desuccinylase
MVEIFSKALNKSTQVDRIIGKLIGNETGPTVVFYGGIHGNETAGVFALKKVFEKVNKKSLRGTVYGISGNLKALKENQRFLNQDLNRLWINGSLEVLEKRKSLNIEENEQQVLFKILQDILKEETGPFYFIDLHTTSSKTLPFITINDSIINRKFSSLFPVPIVLGIEEYLEGPLLSYINQLGYVSLGFESGQHDSLNAVTNNEAFVFLSLVFAEILEKNEVPKYQEYLSRLKEASNFEEAIFEITYLYRLNKDEDFVMKPSFESFQNIKKGEVLAKSNGRYITSPSKAKLFMPLYQKKGKEGFFIIKKIHPFFLKLSEILRKVRIDSLLVALPGIRWKDKNEGILRVNLKVAKYLAKQIFHLLGYRSKQIDATHVYLFNRERTSKTAAYKNLKWYKKSR